MTARKARTPGRSYLVEGWRGLECVGFRRVSRPRSAVLQADRYCVDLEADRVYIRAEGTAHGLLATWQLVGGWRRVDDPALLAAIPEAARPYTPEPVR
jgi:hypothetical protein